MNELTQYLPNSFPSVPNFLVVWRPVLSQDPESRFKVDKSSLNLRTVGVALASLGALVGTLASQSNGSPQYLFLDAEDASSLCCLISFIFVKIYRGLENYRAAHSATEMAIQDYMQNKSKGVPTDVMEYLVTNPKALRKLLAQPNVNLAKTEIKNGHTLLEFCIEEKQNTSLRYHPDRARNLFLSLQLIVQNEAHLTPVQVLKLARLSDFYFRQILITALSNDKIKSRDFTPDQIYDLWYLVADDTLASLLINKGFAIDTKNKTGESLLDSLLRNSFQRREMFYYEKIKFLIKHGAKLPEDNARIEIKEKGSETFKEKGSKTLSKTFKKWIETIDGFKVFLDLCKSETTNLNIPKESRILSLAPAIDVRGRCDDFKVNMGVIAGRILIVANPIFYTISAVLAIQFSTSLPLCLMGVVPLLFVYERSRAVKALNKIAIEVFQRPLVRYTELEYIAKNSALIDQLIQKNANLLNSDEYGRTLLNVLCEDNPYSSLQKVKFDTKLANFKKIADKMLEQISSDDAQKKKLFIKAAMSIHGEYVAYLIEKKWVEAINFSDEEQFNLWTGLGDTKTAQILKDGGFNPNVKDKGNGYTPLMRVLASSHDRTYYSNITPYQHAEALIKAGADPSVRVKRSGKEDVTCSSLVKGTDNLKRLIDDALSRKTNS